MLLPREKRSGHQKGGQRDGLSLDEASSASGEVIRESPPLAAQNDFLEMRLTRILARWLRSEKVIR